MDSNRRPQLPALSYLADLDKVKREDDAYQHRNTANGTPQSLSTSAAASPTYHYPPGPPPPYSHAHGIPPTNTWTSANAGVHTPPKSRRTSDNDREGAKQRQSLPSLSEALGIDRETASTAAAPPTLQPTHPPQPQSTAPRSPSPTNRRSFPMEPPQAPPSSYTSSHTYSQYSTSYPEPARTAPAAYPPAPERKPPSLLQTSQPPAVTRPLAQTTSFSRAPDPSPTYEQPSSHTSGTMGPPPSTFPYGYTPFPPRYANPTPPSSTSSGPIYQPSAYTSAQPSQPGWKAESRYDDRQMGQANYGDNVKRHLDFYDLEEAVNEIAQASGILSDFSRRYGDRMHQTQRSGATLNTLPGLVEVDDMINKSRIAHDSLMKIRDVILQQQAVFEQQAADQRHQHKLFVPQAQHQPEHHEQQADETKAGGFAGVDTKKRRGRAAPPGRCHSCNRAETPEWRRGPDGARTLCNACGLHYAKLTRKKGANNSTSVGSSNLRPKETQ